MAKTTIVNIHDLVNTATRNYIATNAATFKSTVAGPQGVAGAAGTNGTNGVDGKSAYQIWLALGNTGSQIDFINSLIGTDGVDGIDGKSAYDIWLDEGNTGDEVTFLASLKGNKGDAGQSVHHTSYTRSRNGLGVEIGPVDPGQIGNVDTYTVWDGQEELPEQWLGEFKVHNGTAGDMWRSTYDTNHDGVVDNSDKVGGKTLTELENERDAAIAVASLGLGTNFIVADIAGRDALINLTEGDKVFVEDDGDGKWAHYITLEVTDGQGSTSTFRVIMDEDTYLQANTKESIKTAYESNPDTNAYTDADKSKLAGIEAGATADQTATEIKSLYESNANTNVYTDAEKTKLTEIEAGATADQTGAEIKALYEAQTDKILDNVTRVGLNGTNTVGQMTWNATEQTADLVLSSDVTLQLGQELLARVRNNSGSTIVNGTVVMVTGALSASGNMTVAPHDGTRANGRKIAGLVTHDIANGVDGLTLLRGKIRGLDTTGSSVGETWLEGDWLFIKPNDGGKLTKIEPADNELKMPVAIVLNAHAHNGTLQVRTTGTDENAFKDWVNTKLAVTEW